MIGNDTGLTIGPTKWGRGGKVFWDYYATPTDKPNLALFVQDSETDLRALNLTTNIPDAPLEDGQVWIKDWSENEGVMEAMIEAGLATFPGDIFPINFVEAKLAILQPKLLVSVWGVTIED